MQADAFSCVSIDWIEIWDSKAIHLLWVSCSSQLALVVIPLVLCAMLP